MPSREEVIDELETVDSKVEISAHAHGRAKRRNVDIESVKRRLHDLDIEEVRANPDEDRRFEKTYKITVAGPNDEYYEMPVHFNMHGNRIYVKSVWPR